MLDRFLDSLSYRKSQTTIGWDEEFCVAAEDHSHIATTAERSRNENSWNLVLDTSGKHGPMEQRDDYQEAEKTKERLYEEHGKGQHQNPHQGSRSTTTKWTIYWDRRGFWACRPQNGLEVVRPSINKFFILKLASSFMVEIYIMGWAIFFADSRCFRLQAMAIPLQATGGVHRTPNPHAMSRSAHVIFLAQCSKAYLVSHVAQGPFGSSQNGVLSSQKHLSSH